MAISDKAKTRIGHGLSGLVILFMLFDGSIKLVPLAVVMETTGCARLPRQRDPRAQPRHPGARLHGALRCSAHGRARCHLVDGLPGRDRGHPSACRQSRLQPHAFFGAYLASCFGAGSICATIGCEPSSHIADEWSLYSSTQGSHGTKALTISSELG